MFLKYFVHVYVLFLFLFRALFHIKFAKKHNFFPLAKCTLSTIREYYIIIPVYQEVEVIKNCLVFYDKILSQDKLNNIRILFVCTQREGDEIHNPTFNKIIEIKKNLINYNRIHQIIAPSRRRFMAGQLNEAIVYIKKISEQSFFSIAIYNVDSRFSFQSLLSNFYLLEKSENSIIQQYGCYLNNFNQKPKTILQKIYQEAAVWQTSWAMQFEIRNSLYNNWLDSLSLSKHLKTIFKKFSYVVGHGLFLKEDIIKGLHFTEEYQNEDMEISIKFLTKEISIIPGVSFSYSDMPLTLRDYFLQQAVWARGPLLGIKYAISYIKNNKKENSLTILLWGIKLFLHYLYWVSEPIIIFFGAVFLAAGKDYSLLFALLSLYISYLYLVFSLPYYNRQDEKKQFIMIKPFYNRLLYIILFHLLHCIGPIICLKNYILETFGKKKLEKFKTPKANID